MRIPCQCQSDACAGFVDIASLTNHVRIQIPKIFKNEMPTVWLKQEGVEMLIESLKEALTEALK